MIGSLPESQLQLKWEAREEDVCAEHERGTTVARLRCRKGA